MTFDLRHDEIVVDQFAGGGGASTGIAWTTSREPEIVINHDAEAIAMHTANHADSAHYIEDVWKVDPKEVCMGRKVGLMWMSPTCTHFSKAKGTALDASSLKLRALAWVGVRWAAAVRPRIICLENVEEFAKWGPLHRSHSPDCDGSCVLGRFLDSTNPAAKKCQLHKPIKSRQGETFRAFIRRLEKLGYEVKWWLKKACDFGAPTTRRRLVLVARCDGQPIVEPVPTHGTGLLPYRTAAECIDWSNLGKSIFDEHGNTRHAGKTLARIAAGIQKFVLNSARPFIVPVAYGSHGARDNRTNSIDEPAPTVCGNREDIRW